MTIYERQRIPRQPPSNFLVTVPNALSVVRGCLGPIVMWLITLDVRWGLITALILMIAAEVSDYIDGIIARKFNQESQFGRVIDPICDSIYHLSVFLAFLYMGWMPAWMLFIIYSRDLIVPYIRAFAHQRGQAICVRDSGKIKTVMHAMAQIGVVILVLNMPNEFVGSWIDTLPTMLLLMATAASVYSLLDYGIAASKFMRD